MNDSQQIKYNSENPENNYKKAAKKLKEMQLNIDMIKNRFKVLHSQQQYHRYKTIDQSNKIALHQSLHQKIQKQKDILKKSMKKITDNKILRQKCLQQRQETKKKFMLMKKRLIQERMSRSRLRNDEFLRNENRLKQLKQIQQLSNRFKKQKIAKQQQKIKQNCKKYLENKIKTIILNKTKQTSKINQQSNSLSRQIQLMLQLERNLMQKYGINNESTIDLKGKYSQIMNSTHKSHSSRLPQISKSITNPNTFIT